MSETPQDHEHDTVPVMSADETQVRLYCRSCGHRGEWRDVDLTSMRTWTEDELEEIKRTAAAGGASTFGALTAEGGN